jgi:hypothetical protein
MEKRSRGDPEKGQIRVIISFCTLLSSEQISTTGVLKCTAVIIRDIGGYEIVGTRSDGECDY